MNNPVYYTILLDENRTISGVTYSIDDPSSLAVGSAVMLNEPDATGVFAIRSINSRPAPSSCAFPHIELISG
jgi:hypothetical protein